MENLFSFIQKFKGDPKQQVMDLVKSKGINNQAYNDAVNKANMIYKMIYGMK